MDKQGEFSLLLEHLADLLGAKILRYARNRVYETMTPRRSEIDLPLRVKISCIVHIIVPTPLLQARHFRIMQDDFILVVLTIKVLCPSLSFLSGAFLDWGVLMIAAFRLAAVISALVV